MDVSWIKTPAPRPGDVIDRISAEYRERVNKICDTIGRRIAGIAMLEYEIPFSQDITGDQLEAVKVWLGEKWEVKYRKEEYDQRECISCTLIITVRR
jgi:hypothetical protein